MAFGTILGIIAGIAIATIVNPRRIFQWISAITSYIYNVFILHMTQIWYREVLNRLEANSNVLDIGIGTAGALLHWKNLLLSKNIKVIGIDYNAFYIDAANAAIQNHNLQSHIQAHCISVYEMQKNDQLRSRKFDAAYFSGSLSLLPDPVLALQKTGELVKPGGKIYITQTFEPKEGKGTIMNWIKPRIKYLTTIDFGQVISQDEIIQLYKQSGFPIAYHEVVMVTHTRQEAFLTILNVT